MSRISRVSSLVIALAVVMFAAYAIGGVHALTLAVSVSALGVVYAPSSSASSMGYRIAEGQHTTVAASDVITVNGMRKILRVVATLEDDPVAGAQHVTAVPSGSEDGKFTVKTWKATAAADTALIAATTFSRKVNWICFGY